ncbi:LysR family transcriptional regulator [Azoarcus communis]|uniref:LysR family transcriptional regulator n=1 Tax=Parazoarcus communis TaxID=41977 RepID=UPI0014593354|nr:LysR family transcriptional regulator [Parazoarcus communis]NMG50806.1 LysR family transcriptional regulator [Parazoarcus communis]
MSDFDHSHLDGRLLQLLIAVVEEGSITRAAERLGVTQSAVSHLLGKLRSIVGDPLVVKSGRGIVATVRAEALARDARHLLDEMRRFASADEFDPTRLHGTITIAANDFQRDLLLPPLLARLRKSAPRISLRVVPSDVPDADMLREERCQLVISPRPPDATDILHKRLFDDGYRVFYDGSQRTAPTSLEDYLAADHATVLYVPRRALDIDDELARQGILRRFAVTVPGFAAIPAFVRGSTLLATAPGLLAHGAMRGLAHADLPFPTSRLPMYMIWHLRHRHDPAHGWLRTALESVIPTLALG